MRIELIRMEEKEPRRMDTPVMLNNGDLIVINSNGKKGDQCLLVSTYGDNKKEYCSLIDLRTGARSFTEPCSRNTDIGRIFNHLRRHGCLRYEAQDFQQYKADDYYLTIRTELGVFE